MTDWTPMATVLTVQFCIMLIIYLSYPFIVRRYRNIFGMAYLHTRWYMLALLGCVTLAFENLLSEIVNNSDLSSWGKAVLITWIPYQFGVPLLHLPILVRGWRVICIYTSTFDLRTFSRTSPLVRRRRDDTWLMVRVLVMLLPLCITYGFLFLSYQADWGTVAYTAFTVLLLLLVAIRLVMLMPLMEAKLRLETKWLLVTAIVFFMYFAWQNISWYELQKNGYDTLGMAVECILVDSLFILISVMWLTTPTESSAFKSRSDTCHAPLRGFGSAHISRGGQVRTVSRTLSSRDDTTHSAAAQTEWEVERDPAIPRLTPGKVEQNKDEKKAGAGEPHTPIIMDTDMVSVTGRDGDEKNGGGKDSQNSGELGAAFSV